jgi:hypothetical protein
MWGPAPRQGAFDGIALPGGFTTGWSLAISGFQLPRIGAHGWEIREQH